IVSVPKILDVLKDHVTRTYGGPETSGGPERTALRNGTGGPETAAPRKREHFTLRWWRYRAIHPAVGLKFWAFVVGAAPLDSSLEAFWGELGFVVVQGYGLTETAPIGSFTHPFGTRKGSGGKAMAGVDVKIAADGEILVRGENVTKGYFNAAEE